VEISEFSSVFNEYTGWSSPVSGPQVLDYSSHSRCCPFRQRLFLGSCPL
jgi:hypothetical protein